MLQSRSPRQATPTNGCGYLRTAVRSKPAAREGQRLRPGTYPSKIAPRVWNLGRRIHRSCKPEASQGCPYPSHTKHNRHHVVAVVGAGARSIFAGSGKGPWLGAGTLDTARVLVVREVRTLVTDQWGLRPLAVSLQRHVNWLGLLKEHA